VEPIRSLFLKYIYVRYYRFENIQFETHMALRTFKVFETALRRDLLAKLPRCFVPQYSHPLLIAEPIRHGQDYLSKAIKQDRAVKDTV